MNAPRPYQVYAQTVHCRTCGKEIEKSRAWRKEVASGHYDHYCPTLACYESQTRIWERRGG